MIIKKVHLYNIRSYIDEVIEIDRGITLFEGDIGSGKTTILMSIDFALFGNSTRNFYERLLRKGATKGFVDVVFEYKGQEYTIHRELEKRGNSIINTESYVITPQGKLKLTSSDIRNYVLNLMGVDATKGRKKSLPVVKYAIYTPQETMKEILEGSDDERLDVIRRIFRLDEYKMARENAKKVARYLGQDLAIANTKREEVEDMMEEIERNKKQLEDIEKELKDLEKVMKDLTRRYEIKRKEWDSIQETRKMYESLRADIESIKVRMESLKNNIDRDRDEIIAIEKMEKRLGELKEDALKYEKMEREREELQREIDAIRNVEVQYRSILEKIKVMEKKVSELDEKRKDFERLKKVKEELEAKVSKLESLEEEKKELERERNDVRSRIQVLNDKMQELYNELEEIKGLGAICPKCKRPLTEEHKKKLIEETMENIEKLKGEIIDFNRKDVDIKKKLRDIEKEIEGLRELNKELARTEEKIRNISREIEDIEKLKEEIDKERSNLPKFDESRKNELIAKMEFVKKEIERLREIWNEYNKLSRDVSRKPVLENRVASYEEELEKLGKEFEEKMDRLNSLDYSEERYNSIGEEYRKIAEELSSVKTKIREKKNRMEELSKEIELKLKRIEELNREIKIFSRRGEFGEWLRNEFSDILEDIEKMRLISINEEFKTLFEKWFYELLGESEYEATIDESFRPIIRYEKFDMSLSSLSGGERTSIALAYRLALNAMVKRSLNLDTNLLILDEPTDGFSKDQLYKLKDVFEKMETDQIIIVSHEKELMNLADRVYHVEKIEGVSSINEVSG